MIGNEAEARSWLQSHWAVDGLAWERLNRLEALLTAESERQNLISASSLEHVWQRHFADSAQLLNHVPRETSGRWLDLGTGGGFPGLIIAILKPEMSVTLVESRSLRCGWLNRAKDDLELDAVTVMQCSIERASKFDADYISARAFAPLARLLELSARFSTSETIWLLPKGRSAKQELQELQGWRHMFHVEQSLTDPSAGIIVGTVAGRKGRNQ